MKELIRQHALALGFSACGFTSAKAPDSAAVFAQWLAAGFQGEMQYLKRSAAQRIDLQKVLPGARSLVCLAVSYAWTAASPASPPVGSPLDSAEGSSSHSRNVPKSAGQRPMTAIAASTSIAGFIARYSRCADYHLLLAQPLRQVMDKLRELGGPQVQSVAHVDAGPVLERDLAQRAGLGFIGKHTNLINRCLGNWIFLAEILTTLDLDPDVPEKNRCGACRRCLDACPTGAIVGPFQLDARRCLAYLTIELKGPIPVELRPAMGRRIFGCDDCLAVCPWNRFARAGQLLKAHYRPDLQQPDLLELLQLNPETFKQRFGDTPIQRVKLRGLLRNVCVALGNTGDRSALPALTKLAAGQDGLVAEHAAWAVQRISGSAEAAST